jgi:hypothetical protein
MPCILVESPRSGGSSTRHAPQMRAPAQRQQATLLRAKLAGDVHRLRLRRERRLQSDGMFVDPSLRLCPPKLVDRVPPPSVRPHAHAHAHAASASASISTTLRSLQPRQDRLSSTHARHGRRLASRSPRLRIAAALGAARCRANPSRRR